MCGSYLWRCQRWNSLMFTATIRVGVKHSKGRIALDCPRKWLMSGVVVIESSIVLFFVFFVT